MRSFDVKPLAFPRVLQRSRGFTLIELIGVLIIISLLLAAVAPLTIQLIQSQQQIKEKSYLPEIAQALRRGILSEQRFPFGDSSLTDAADAAAWWRMAARHGAGGENQVRYPRGSFAAGDLGRRLYLAKPAWEGKSFYEITGGENNWLSDVNDATELRLVLLSVADSNLPLPDSLTAAEFDQLWSTWVLGPTGDPSTGTLADYGLANAWKGRAAELNVQRIDLRDLLCRVVIENRRYLNALYDVDGNQRSEISITPQSFTSDSMPEFGTFNLQDARVQLDLTIENATDEVIVSGFLVLQAGRLIDEQETAGFVVSGQQVDTDGNVATARTDYTIYTNGDTDSRRAQLALLNPLDPEDLTPLGGWDVTDDSVQERYFLKSQELLLEAPTSGREVGIFVIERNYQTLRYDGLRWKY